MRSNRWAFILLSAKTGTKNRKEGKMAIARCGTCGPPRSPKGGAYVAHHFPVGHPNSGVICGRLGRENSAGVWLKKNEEEAYQDGERIFQIHTQTAKVKLQ